MPSAPGGFIVSGRVEVLLPRVPSLSGFGGATAGYRRRVSDFATSIERLLTQVRHWDERRWRAAAPGATTSRSHQVRGLVQHLADLGAEAENRPARPVPHLHDLVLGDQLRVLADDLLTAAAALEILERATAAVDEVRKAL